MSLIRLNVILTLLKVLKNKIKYKLKFQLISFDQN